MLRKISLLLAIASAAIAFTSTSAAASGPAFVVNLGENEISAEETLAIGIHHPSLGFLATFRCNLHINAEVAQDGHVDLYDVDIDPHGPNDVGDCLGLDDCDDAGWEGQIHESEDHESEFGIELHMCFEAGGISSAPVETECSMFDTEFHCDDPIFHEGTTTPALLSGFPTEIVGEATVRDDLGLEHG